MKITQDRFEFYISHHVKQSFFEEYVDWGPSCHKEVHQKERDKTNGRS